MIYDWWISICEVYVKISICLCVSVFQGSLLVIVIRLTAAKNAM